MACRILYKASVEKDLRRLDKKAARLLLDKIEQVLSADPARGTPLAGEFRGLLKLRVGDNRVLYARVPEGVLILRVGHRKEACR